MRIENDLKGEPGGTNDLDDGLLGDDTFDKSLEKEDSSIKKKRNKEKRGKINYNEEDKKIEIVKSDIHEDIDKISMGTLSTGACQPS